MGWLAVRIDVVAAVTEHHVFTLHLHLHPGPDRQEWMHHGLCNCVGLFRCVAVDMFPTRIYFCSRNGYVAYYRPQRSCGKVIFSQASVILSTGGVCQTPPGRHPLCRHHPPGQTTSLLGRHPLGRHTPPADGYCCGRYASYWNAFLFLNKQQQQQ